MGALALRRGGFAALPRHHGRAGARLQDMGSNGTRLWNVGMWAPGAFPTSPTEQGAQGWERQWAIRAACEGWLRQGLVDGD